MEQQIAAYECDDHLKFTRMSWLFLFYRMPMELLQGKRAYTSIPRAPYEALHEEPFSSWIDSEAFICYIRTACAKVVWRFLRVPARKDSYQRMPDSISYYSADCPIVQLANEAAEHMRSMPEIASPSLGAMPVKWKFPWPSLQDFYGMVAELTDRIVEEQNWQPIIDYTWKHLTLEDFSAKRSHRKTDTQRRWDHKRTKIGRSMISYDSLLETAAESGYNFDIPDYEADPLKILEKREDALEISEDVQYHGWAVDGPYDKWLKGLEEKTSERLLEMLEERGDSLSLEDRQLLALRNEGYTLAEIAVIAGFSSHSGVIGRLKQIVVYCKDGTPLKPRRNGKRGGGFYSRFVGSIPRRKGSVHKARLYIGNVFSLCRYCLRKDKPGRCDDLCRAYKQGTICAASDLTKVCQLQSKPRKKRACCCEQKHN